MLNWRLNFLLFVQDWNFAKFAVHKLHLQDRDLVSEKQTVSFVILLFGEYSNYTLCTLKNIKFLVRGWMFVKLSRVSTSNILLNWVCICYFPFNYQPEVSLRAGSLCGLGKSLGKEKMSRCAKRGGLRMGFSQPARRACSQANRKYIKHSLLN